MHLCLPMWKGVLLNTVTLLREHSHLQFYSYAVTISVRTILFYKKAYFLNIFIKICPLISEK